MGGHSLNNKEAHSIYEINRIHVLMKYVECKPQYTNLVKIDKHEHTHTHTHTHTH